MATEAQKHTVFISYSHQDTEFVNQFAAILVACGLPVWKDTKDILIGDNIPVSVFEALKKASHFCCIISRHSANSAWVEDELSYAKMRRNEDRSLKIVPVLIDKVEMPESLRAYRYADLRSRDLSLSNPHLAFALRSFGLSEPGITPVVTNEARVKLLARCRVLSQKLFEFRDRTKAYSETKAEIEKPISHYPYHDDDYQSGGGGSSYRSGWDWSSSSSGPDRLMEAYAREGRREAREEFYKAQRERLRETAKYHWGVMREIAPQILQAATAVREAGTEAGIDLLKETDWLKSYFIKEFHVWKDLSEVLYDVTNTAGIVVANESYDFDSGAEYEYRVGEWTPELVQAETKLKSVIGVLESWSSLDKERM